MIVLPPLTPLELQQVALVGTTRQIISMGTHDAYGRKSPMERWGLHIEGAGAEFAFAKWRGKFWNALVGPEEFRELEGDVGNVQVRSCWRAYGRLLVHPGDRDDAHFVLVTGALPRFTIVGRMLGRKAKQKVWWDTKLPEPAYAVPQAELTPIGTT